MILQQLQGIIKLLLGAEILPDEVSLKIVPAKDFYTAKYLQQVKNMQVCRKKRDNGTRRKIQHSQLLKHYWMEMIHEHNN